MAVLSGNLDASNRDTLETTDTKLDAGQQYGRVRRAYDEYVIPAADELGTSAVVQFMTLPKNATIIDARWIGPNITAGACTVGSADDADLLFTAAETAMTAAVDLRMSALRAGYNTRLTAETIMQAAITTQTNGGGGETIALEVFYIVD